MVTDLTLVLNMDESCFGKRPYYKKSFSCFFFILLNGEIPPMFLAKTDNYHISCVYCISAACSWTRHLFIATWKTMKQGFHQTFLNQFAFQHHCKMWLTRFKVFSFHMYQKKSLMIKHMILDIILEIKRHIIFFQLMITIWLILIQVMLRIHFIINYIQLMQVWHQEVNTSGTLMK